MSINAARAELIAVNDLSIDRSSSCQDGSENGDEIVCVISSRCSNAKRARFSTRDFGYDKLMD